MPWDGRLTVGVDNLFDRDPPLIRDTYNRRLYDPYGRSFYLRYRKEL